MANNNSNTLNSSVLNVAPPIAADENASFAKLPPLNPDDLKLPPPPPSAADKVTHTQDAISIQEVWDEIKAKMKEIIIGSSVSGVMQAMRVINMVVAGLMLTLCVAAIITSSSVFRIMSDCVAVFYTIFFALLLIGYELRSKQVDDYLRESFGFMYNPWGRCLFLSMISIFPFGLVGSYGVLVSLIGFANAYFNYFVITKHPSFTRGVPDYIPPAIDSTSSAGSSRDQEDNTVV